MNQLFRLLPVLLLTIAVSAASAQKKPAFVSGRVLNESEEPLPRVSVTLLGQQRGLLTNDSGYFELKVPADRAFALVFSYTGYQTAQQNFLLNEGEREVVTVLLERKSTTLQNVLVTDQRDRSEAGLIRLNPKSVINLPSPVMGVEGLIKVFVGSNNELTSQYNVRGGSYDENLIYVNDFEVFRPYLVRSGQQEGLSFINPEMVQNISFYNGGFQARYGDKMSSVLDIQYKKPKGFGGSAYVSLLEQGAHLEGTASGGRLSYMVGARNRSNRNLLSSQETQGNYVPSSADLQALVSYQLSPKWQAEVLANVSATRFTLLPQFSQLTSAVFTPTYTRNLAVDIYFAGREKDRYATAMLGMAATFQPYRNLRLKWLVSRFGNDEEENMDISGAYLFGDREFDKSKATYGTIVNPLGAGLYQNFTRNSLNISDYNLSHKGSLDTGRHLLQWGLGYNRTGIRDQLSEWQLQDSAGYNVPYNPDRLALYTVLRSSADLTINKFNGYLQDNIALGDSARAVTLQAGLRFNYNDLNNELLLSPRAGMSWKPDWKRNVIFRAAAGAYHQPPFYREMRRYDGSLNTNVKAQRSWQAVAGFDYHFIAMNRPIRFTTEGYYKRMTNVVPYDLDNVRVRYFGENTAKAYAAGLEMRVFGELVKDAESWISLGLLRTREDLKNDFYKVYRTDSLNRPVDSVMVEGGYVRRPTDRLITFGMFFQDYLSTNQNFKVYLSLLYGSNLPYNIPGSVRYRNALIIDPYIRMDIGFSALLAGGERGNRRSHSPFRNFDDIWASLEVFNLIDRPNTISYLLVKDFANNTFAMPNRLTPRLINFKLVARW